MQWRRRKKQIFSQTNCKSCSISMKLINISKDHQVSSIFISSFVCRNGAHVKSVLFQRNYASQIGLCLLIIVI